MKAVDVGTGITLTGKAARVSIGALHTLLTFILVGINAYLVSVWHLTCLQWAIGNLVVFAVEFLVLLIPTYRHMTVDRKGNVFAGVFHLLVAITWFGAFVFDGVTNQYELGRWVREGCFFGWVCSIPLLCGVVGLFGF